MLKISHCNINIIEDYEIEEYLKFLPPFMAEEVTKYKFSADQKSRLLARLMLLKSLEQENKAHLLNDWKRDDRNRPYIEGWKSFNISHSENVTVLCYGDGKVGIDIEKVIPMNFRELTKYFCSEEEENYIQKADMEINNFYEAWVRKEALFKAVGDGVVNENDLKQVNCLKESVTFKGGIWYLRKMNLYPGYTCFLCSSSSTVQPQIIDFNRHELLV